MKASKKNSPWVLLDINKIVYAVSCEIVLSLSQLPEITPLPKTPKEIRGVVDFRGRSIQLIDSRTMLGLKSVSDDVEEFNNLMDQRLQDHKNWIATLESSVKNGEVFTLTTDPHKCAFGKWYDSFPTENENLMFTSAFARFDEPHKEIHQIGVKTQEFISMGKHDEAVNLINSVKSTTLIQMFHLFDELKLAYKDSRKEIMVVIGDEKKKVGLSVDRIVAIEALSEIDEDLLKHSITNTNYLSGLGKRKDGSVSLILDDEFILSKFH